MAARCVLALLLVAATPAAGQTFMSRMRMWTPTHSSSLVKEQTWVAGSDGEMHRQVHEMRTDVDMNHGMRREVNQESLCADGHCQGTVSVVSMPQGSRFQRIHARLREMMQRLSETRYKQPAQPAQVIAMPARVVFLGPRVQAPPPAAEVQVYPAPPEVNAPSWTAVQGAVALAATTSIFMFFVMRCLRLGDSSEARELTGLAEPFAPEEQPARLAAAAPKAKPSAAVASAAASKFLGSVYSQVETKMRAAEAEASSAYLQRVYERATA